MNLSKRTYVAKIDLASNSYYVTNRPDVSLNGLTYSNLVRYFGDVGFYNNTLEGKYQVSSMDIELINGEEFLGNGYVFSSTDIWNNYSCEVRLYDVGNVEFQACTPVIKGKIKNFSIAENIFSFTLESVDERDDVLLPTVLCPNNAGEDNITAVVGWEPYHKFQVSPGAASIYSRNELIALRYDTSHSEVTTKPPYVMAAIKEIDSLNEWITVKENVEYNYRVSHIEKAFRNIPINSVNKTIPMQYGNLNDAANGVFGKTVTINELVGRQKILFDTFSLHSSDSIGVWDNDYRRYYEGQKGAVVTKMINNPYEGYGTENQSTIEGEYELFDNNNAVDFRADTTCVLTDSTSAATGIQQISVTNAEYISYYRETTAESFKDIPESLFQNVLSIESELLLMVDEPDTTSNTLVVERGFNNTTVAVHPNGAKVYQGSKYSSRKFLFFSERFTPTSLSNFYYAQDLVGGDTFTQYHPGANDIPSGNWSNVIDSDTATYVRLFFTHNSYVNFNIFFPVIEKDFKVVDAYFAGRFYYRGDRQVNLYFYIADPSRDTYYNDNYYTLNDKATFWFNAYMGYVLDPNIETDFAIDSYTNKVIGFALGSSGNLIGGPAPFKPYIHANKPQLRRDERYRDSFSIPPGPSPQDDIERPGTPFKISSLKDLNKKWKLQLNIRFPVSSSYGYAQIYNVGVWVDFIADYTRETVVAPLEGREVTTEVSAITGTTTGELCVSPIDVMAHILIHELGYDGDDFGTGWEPTALFDIFVNDDVDTAQMDVWAHELAYGNGYYVATSNESPNWRASFYATDPYGAWGVTSTSFPFEAVTFSSAIGMFFAIGKRYVYKSTNGVTWSYASLSSKDLIRAVGDKVVAYGQGRGGKETTDGIAWSTQSDRLPVEFTSSYIVTGFDIVGDYLVVFNTGNMFAYSNDDTATWTYGGTMPSTSPYSSQFREAGSSGTRCWYECIYGNDVYIAVWSHKGSKTNGIALSTGLSGGFDWVTDFRGIEVDGVSSYLETFSGCFDGDYFIVSARYVVESGSGTQYTAGLLYSTNGTTWYFYENFDYNLPIYGVLYNSDDNLVVMAQENDKFLIMDKDTVRKQCAMSYGGDDKREKGFDFVSKIGNHFNYIVGKSYDGKIEISDIYDVYNIGQEGYKVEIEEIAFLAESGQRRIVIFQTGTDLIYNDVIVKYKRNNANNEYQASYTVPESYPLTKSGISLKAARETYYSGSKRTLTIESPFIYNETDAQNLAETKIDEFAEIHFYIELVIDFDHYSESNDLTDQYKKGDIFYLNGIHGGVTFDSNRKFYVQDTIIADNGREMQLHLKSLDPISEF